MASGVVVERQADAVRPARSASVGVARGVLVPFALVALQCARLIADDPDRPRAALPVLVLAAVAITFVYRWPRWLPLVVGAVGGWLLSDVVTHLRGPDDLVVFGSAVLWVFAFRAPALDRGATDQTLRARPEGVAGLFAVGALVASGNGSDALPLVVVGVGVVLATTWERHGGREPDLLVAVVVALLALFAWRWADDLVGPWSWIVFSMAVGWAATVAAVIVVGGRPARRMTAVERAAWRSMGAVAVVALGAASMFATVEEPALSGLIGGAGCGLVVVAILHRRDRAWITGHALRASVLLGAGLLPFGYWIWLPTWTAAVAGIGMGAILAWVLVVGSSAVVAVGWVVIGLIGLATFTVAGAVCGALTLAVGLIWWPIVPGLRRGRAAARTVLLPVVLVPVAVALRPSVNDLKQILAVLALGTAAVLLVPGPPGLLDRARRAQLPSWSGPVGHGAAIALGAAGASVQAAWDAGGRVLGPVWTWITAPSDEAAPPGRLSRVAASRWSYVLPVAGWAIGSMVVQVIAGRMGVHPRHAAFGSRGLLQPPYSLATHTRLGNGSGNDFDLARHGYHLGEWLEPVFPLVPLVLRGLHQATGIEVERAQIALSTVMGNVAAVAYWAFLRVRKVPVHVQVAALGLFFTYPYAFVIFGFGYSDTTLLALVLVAFLLVERRHPVWAGVVGALATATRPNAGPIIVGLLLFELTTSGALGLRWPTDGLAGAWRERRTVVRLRLGRMRAAQWGVLLSASGLVAFSAWMTGHAGSPLYWMTAQSHYGHGSLLEIRTWLKVGFLENPAVTISSAPRLANEIVHGLVVIGAIFLIPAVHRRLGLAYSAFTALVLAIAYTGGIAFAAGGRYLLPAMPFLALVMADSLVSRRRALHLTLTAFVAAQVLLVAGFSAGLRLEW